MLRSASFQMTDACNLACTYCYYAHKAPTAISQDIMDNAVELFLQQVDPSTPKFGVNFFGGEPFMARDEIEYLINRVETRFAQERPGMRIGYSTTTNGTLFDARALKLCLNHRINVQLSVDGARAAHDRFRKYKNGRGSFDRIVANLPNLKQVPGFGVRMTISPDTVDELPDGIAFLIDQGVSRIGVSPVSEQEWTEDEVRRFALAWRKVSALYMLARERGQRVAIRSLSFEEGSVEEDACRPIRSFGCGAAVSFVFVDYSGQLYPCHRYPGYFDRSPEVRIGDVWSGFDHGRRDFFIEANRGAVKKGCASFVPGIDAAASKCSDCIVSSSCGGACIALNHVTSGDPKQPPSTPGKLKQIMLEVKRQAMILESERNAAFVEA